MEAATGLRPRLQGWLRLALALALGLAAAACALHVPAVGALLHAPAWVHAPSALRVATPVMKGKGSRGMPGKLANPLGTPTGGMQKNSKSKMQQRDFSKDEWQLVAEAGDLPEEFGATKAVAAGRTPKGQEYIWVLVRGEEEDGEKKVYATDGSCRCCLFPMTKGEAERTSDGPAIRCTLCGTSYSLLDGKVLQFCPKRNPIEWATAAANEKNGPVAAASLPTRVSKADRIYLRLPDGTLTDKNFETK